MNELPQGWGSQDENFSPWNNQQLQNPPQPSSVNLTGSSTPLEQQKPEPFSQPISPNHTTASPQQPPITPVPPLFSDGSASPNVPLIDNPPSNSNTAIKAIAALLAVAAIGVSGFFIVKAIQKNKEPQIQKIAEVEESSVIEQTTISVKSPETTKVDSNIENAKVVVSSIKHVSSTLSQSTQETVTSTNIILTTPVVRELPTVSGEIQGIPDRDDYGNYWDGTSYYINLSGNFDYCKLQVKDYDNKNFRAYPDSNTTFKQGSTYLGGGSWLGWNSFEVIPYFSDGTSGTTITILSQDFKQMEGQHPSDTWRNLYLSQLNEFARQNENYLELCRYSLFDVNTDGVPELFISDGEAHASACEIYTVLNGACIYLDTKGEWGTVGVSQSKSTICSGWFGMGWSSGSAYAFDGKSLTLADNFNYPVGDDGYGNTTGTYNGEEMPWRDVELKVENEYNIKYSNLIEVGRDCGIHLDMFKWEIRYGL